MTRAVTCFYHPDVIANTKCERCSRPVCLNDLRKYRREYHGSFDDDFHHHHQVSYDLCIPCYCDWTERDNSLAPRIGLLFMAGFLVFFILVGVSFFSFMPSFFSGSFGMMAPIDIFFMIFPLLFIGIPLIIVGFILYQVFVKSPRKVKEARALKAQFLASLPTTAPPPSTRSTTTTTMPERTSFDMTCFQCGAPLQITDKFCPNCGDPTIEEQEALKKR